MPECRVFDDALSILHLVGGLVLALLGVPGLLLAGFTLYVLYEVVEGRYRRDCPGADILEFLVGVGAGALLRAAISLWLPVL